MLTTALRAVARHAAFASGHLLAFSGLLLLGSAAAFFLYVSILSIMAAVVMLMALMATFFLGIQCARLPVLVETVPAVISLPRRTRMQRRFRRLS